MADNNGVVTKVCDSRNLVSLIDDWCGPVSMHTPSVPRTTLTDHLSMWFVCEESV